MKLCAIPTSVREEQACDTRCSCGWGGKEQSRGQLSKTPAGGSHWTRGTQNEQLPDLALRLLPEEKPALLSQSFVKRWQEYTE